VAVNETLERFGLAQPKDGETLLGEKTDVPPVNNPAALERQRINADADEERFLARAARLLSKSAREDRAGLVAEMKVVLRAPEATRLNALADFVAKLPASIGKDSAQVKAWETLMASALVNGWAANA
jgi:hypothetical protein